MGAGYSQFQRKMGVSPIGNSYSGMEILSYKILFSKNIQNALIATSIMTKRVRYNVSQLFPSVTYKVASQLLKYQIRCSSLLAIFAIRLLVHSLHLELQKLGQVDHDTKEEDESKTSQESTARLKYHDYLIE